MDPLGLAPSDFFHYLLPCRQWKEGDDLCTARYRLPSLAQLCHESPSADLFESFADLFVAWSMAGIHLGAIVHTKGRERRCHYPDVGRGDAIEYCLDTRDGKRSSYVTRFCHHFFLLPEKVEGRGAGELTRFRTEDFHEWCCEEDLHRQVMLFQSHYRAELFIPAECLVGYDSEQFRRIGFHYKVTRLGGETQQLSARSSEFSVERNPSLWSTLQLESS